jgi:hypothetical protein
MTTPEQNTNQELPPLIPSWSLLALAAAAFAIFGIAMFLGWDLVIAIGAGAVAIIMLFVWAIMFPQELLDLIKGRSFIFGASGLIVVILLLFAAGLIYAVVDSRNLSYDFSERDIYSLDTEVRDVLTQMSADPTVPSVYILGFYNVSQAGERDRIEVLFNDMVATSGGKIIGYQFIDPNLEPVRTQQYLNPENLPEPPQTPQLVVAGVDPVTGGPSIDNFEVASLGNDPNAQFNILNSILKLGTTGDFRAYFLAIEGGVDLEAAGDFGGNGFASDLEDKEWTVEQISPLEISGESPSVTLDDPTANAEILVIAGGTEPLNEETLAAIQAYTANGGDLIVLGDINTQGAVTTAQAENFSNFLWETYGVRLNSDLVLDPSQTISRFEIYSSSYGAHPITTNFTAADDWLVYEGAHSIQISPTPPTGVTITTLANTSGEAYSKANFDFTRDVTSAELAFAEGDVRGVTPLAVAVENANTGSRLVLIGSEALLLNQYRQFREVQSPEFVLESVIWASEAQNFASEIANIIPEPPESDPPVFITPEQGQWMSLVALCLLPIGLLGLGVFVWWLQRPKTTN